VREVSDLEDCVELVPRCEDGEEQGLVPCADPEENAVKGMDFKVIRHNGVRSILVGWALDKSKLKRGTDGKYYIHGILTVEVGQRTAQGCYVPATIFVAEIYDVNVNAIVFSFPDLLSPEYDPSCYGVKLTMWDRNANLIHYGCKGGGTQCNREPCLDCAEWCSKCEYKNYHHRFASPPPPEGEECCELSRKEIVESFGVAMTSDRKDFELFAELIDSVIYGSMQPVRFLYDASDDNCETEGARVSAFLYHAVSPVFVRVIRAKPIPKTFTKYGVEMWLECSSTVGTETVVDSICGYVVPATEECMKLDSHVYPPPGDGCPPCVVVEEEGGGGPPPRCIAQHCEKDDDCPPGYECVGGWCCEKEDGAGPPPGCLAIYCESDEDCPPEAPRCFHGWCCEELEDGNGGGPKDWLKEYWWLLLILLVLLLVLLALRRR